MRKLLALLCMIVACPSLIWAACTATVQNHNDAPMLGFPSGPGGTTMNMTATVAAVGDLVVIWAYCFPINTFSGGCTPTAVTLGSQSATQTTVTSNADDGNSGTPGSGQERIYYVLSAAASGSQTLTFTISNAGGNQQMQIAYIDFKPSAGCTFSHDVDSPLGAGTANGAGGFTIPSYSPTAGDVLVNVTITQTHMVDPVGSPWSTLTWTNGSHFIQNSAQLMAYNLSAPGGSVANNANSLHPGDSMQGLLTSFKMTQSVANACTGSPNYLKHDGTLGTLASIGINMCWYASTSGSDTNTGVDVSHAWAHIPGMPTCTNTCASHTPAAGEGFILRGGDSWGQANLGVAWSWNGNSSNPIYIGVDQSWFGGASWVRPIWTCGGVACASNPGGVPYQIQVFGSWTILDNIEFTGLFQTSSGGGQLGSIQHAQPGDEIENSYFHGWTRDTGAGGSDITLVAAYLGGGDSQVANSRVHDNVIDGLDSFNAGVRTGTGIYSGHSVYNNIVRYVFNGINGDFDDIHSNIVEHVDFQASSGAHCNGIYQAHPLTSNTITIYNNVIRDGSAPGCVAWYVQGNAACPTCNVYFYDNLAYNLPLMGNPLISFPGDAGSSGGTGFFYNNTVQSATNCLGNGLSNNAGTLRYSNNHCISPGSVCLTGGGVVCTNDGGNRTETLASANANGYCEPGVGGCSATFPFAPSSGSSPTVSAGLNQNSNVAIFGAPFGFDTTLGIGYDSVNHKVILGRTPVARPTSGAWDIGAYQFSSSGPIQAATPTFSPAAGTYLSSQSVTITSTTGSATICYTNDGTTPTANGAGTCTRGTTLANGGTVTVLFTLLLQAVASASGFTDSMVGSAQYTFPTASTPTTMAGNVIWEGTVYLQ